MKKRFSILTVVIVGFLMMAVGVGATAGYINWNGTDDYEATLAIFEDLEDGIISKNQAINALNSEKSKLESEKEDLDNKVKELTKDLEDKNEDSIDKEEIKKELSILIREVNNKNGLGNKYPYIQEKINGYAELVDVPKTERLEGQGEGGKSDQLEQAEEDMSHILEEARELQKKMNEDVEKTPDPEQ